MHILLSPIRWDRELTASVSGDVLTINGEPYDFTDLPEGATIPANTIPCDFIIGDVERIDGELHLTLLLPHGPNPETWQAFPEPILVSSDGPVDLPANTTVDVTEERVDGGVNIVTTTYRWHREPTVETLFVPDPKPVQEESADVEA